MPDPSLETSDAVLDAVISALYVLQADMYRTEATHYLDRYFRPSDFGLMLSDDEPLYLSVTVSRQPTPPFRDDQS